ncbi:MAG TPA: amino acid permease [Ignavibacteria bacterium]|nr:amino acid permease [Ignavibacteria bacterium]
MSTAKDANKFSTLPVFFTAISTILGAILFLRFGFAVGTLGFFGVILIILLGHLVTIPTALAISEIATNRRVEGGGEYFIISRSFGLNIGATIGIALYLSQAISVAFYIIAFTEAFSPLFEWAKLTYGIDLPRQIVSVPSMIVLGSVIITKGANLGIKALYVVVAILGLSLVAFFLGSTDYAQTQNYSLWDRSFRNSQDFFIVFAIIFPAFTGMTAGVGLSGDLKDPKKSIPLGTITATILGMIIYFFIIWKLSGSASPEDLVSNQLIMSEIALYGWILIPVGLAASTLSSALGSILVAPRTLQAIGMDQSFPIRSLNWIVSRGKGSLNEPRNATIITFVIAIVFVSLGDVDAVASIISMFFMVTYGSICLISFLHHFGSDPSYRPTFRSRWYFSLVGFILCVWLMFQMSPTYAFLAITAMVLLYIGVNSYHKDRMGLESIFLGAIFQLSRNLQVYLQKSKKLKETWRPSAICISKASFERDKAFELLSWISYKHGFGTYLHLIDGYYSRKANQEAVRIQSDLIKRVRKIGGNMIVDTIISPSYTSAIAQALQLPSASGMESNMIIFDFDKKNPGELNQITDNIALTQAGDYDVCVLGCSHKTLRHENGINIWIRGLNDENANLMILLSYIILGHPDWHKSFIKIYSFCNEGEVQKTKDQLNDIVLSGRLPITEKNIEVIEKKEGISLQSLVNEKSKDAALTIIGFREERLKHKGAEIFLGYDQIGDILFVDAISKKVIE